MTIVMQIANLLAITTILIFVKRYKGNSCPAYYELIV